MELYIFVFLFKIALYFVSSAPTEPAVRKNDARFIANNVSPADGPNCSGILIVRGFGVAIGSTISISIFLYNIKRCVYYYIVILY